MAPAYRHRRIGGLTELDPVALRQLLEGLPRRRRGGAPTGEIAEKGFHARRRRRPRNLKRPCAGIAQAMPGAAGHVQHRPGDDDDDPLIQGRAGLPFVDEQHLILIEMLVDGDLRAGQERLGACGKRRAG